MYLYSSPIAYEENGIIVDIDDSIVNCMSFTYKYKNKKNNIQTLYPYNIKNCFAIKRADKKYEFQLNVSENYNTGIKVKYKNVYSEIVDAVEYSNDNNKIVVYGTNNGFSIEVSENNDDLNGFFLRETDYHFKNYYDYIILHDTYGKEFLIAEFKTVTDSAVYNNDISYRYVQDNTMLVESESLSMKGGKRCIDINFRTENLADSTFDSKKQNIFLKSYVHLYNNNKDDISEHYVRLLNDQLYDKKILSEEFIIFFSE